MVGIRLLFLVTDLEIGGTPRVVRDLASRLKGDDISPTVACLAPWGPVAGELLEAGVRVIELGATSPLQLPRVVRDVVRVARSFDVVFSFLMHANTVAAISSVFARDTRYLQSIQTTQPKPSWHWTMQGLIERAAERIVVPSQSVAVAAQKRSHIPPERITVIPNAIDAASFVAMNLSPFDQPVCRVGFIGRLDPVKRVPDLIEAVAGLDQTELHVFGEGADRARIQNTIQAFDAASRVFMHGQTKAPQEALRQIDVLVLPSDAEGFGLVLIEAMAAGIPVIATDVPGIRDVVKHDQTGLLVPARSPRALATAIERMRCDTSLRIRLTRAAQEEVARRYRWETILDQYRAILLNPSR